MRTSCPFRVMLALSRENVASWSKTLALLGPLKAPTRAKHAITASQNSHIIAWHHKRSWVMSWAFQGQHSYGEGSSPLDKTLPRCLSGTSSSSSMQTSMSCLYPLSRSQHPSSGLFSPMEVRTDHIPMCTCPIWYLSVKYDPAHQQRCPPWAHKSQGS